MTRLQGDCRAVLKTLSDNSVQCCITSPPYWGLRSYLDPSDPLKAQEIGNEPTLAEYIDTMIEVFREVRRVLRPDGTCWLNLGDAYAQDSKWGGVSGGKNATSVVGGLSRERRISGYPSKNLLMIPHRVAMALQDDGWWVRSDIVWHKPNAMPESVTDRPTRAHEYVFLLTKSERYYYDADAIAEPSAPGNDKQSSSPNAFRGAGHYRTGSGPANRPGRDMTTIGRGPTRNRRSVWGIATSPYPDAHYATFPERLVETCLLAGTRPDDIVIDPLLGSGTVARVAIRHGRDWIGIELNNAYESQSSARTNGVQYTMESML